jgi:sugar lactone lactonase YvrE
MRRSALLAAAVAVAATVLAAPLSAGSSFPGKISLPNGFRPEGIAIEGKTFYVGSIPTGAVYRGDLRTGQGAVFVPGTTDGTRAAIGMKVDRRDRLFVAGGPTGKAFVYDEDNGAELAAFQLTAAGQPTFINDVVLTRRNAYFTDSQQPTIYAVKRDLSGVRPIALVGFPMVAGQNNLNGIEATRHGRWLLSIQTVTGDLWRIDPDDGGFRKVDLHGASLENGDGLLFVDSRTLLVVQNRDNKIAVVKLGKRYRSGRVVKTITHPDFDVPTTVAKQNGSLFLPNARFGTVPPPDTADTADYWITRVSFKRHRHHGHHGHHRRHH